MVFTRFTDLNPSSLLNNRLPDIDYDKALSEIGELGKWQKRLFVLLWIPSATSAMAVYMYDFTAYQPQHRCAVAGCDGQTEIEELYPSFLNYTTPWDEHLDNYSQCKQYEHISNSNSTCDEENFSKKEQYCDSWVFDHSLIKSSAVEDFGWVCENAGRKHDSQTIYMLGMLIGSLVFGWASDLVGRKLTLMGGLLFLAVGGSFPFFLSPEPSLYYAMYISRFISGMGHVGTFMMTFNLALEYVGTKWRCLFGILIETPFATGGLVVGLVSWAGIRDWQTLSLVLSAPNILVLAYWWLLPESPRWLIAKNKEEKLMQVLENGAEVNGKPKPEAKNLRISDSNSQKNVGKANFLDLFRPLPILLRTGTMFLNWLVTTLCFYGVTSAAATLTPDLYTNYMLAIAVEIPAHFASYFLLDTLGRRHVLGLAQLLAGAACIAAGFIDSDSLELLKIGLALLGKFGAAMSFAIVFVYTAEMFPTEIRSTAVGMSSLSGRIGGLLAPQIAKLSQFWVPLPLIVMGSSSLIGGILVFLSLPETLGKPLPQTMEEALALDKKKGRTSLEVSL